MTLPKSEPAIDLFDILFYLPKDSSKAKPVWGPYDSISILRVWEAVLTILKSAHQINLFDIVLSPKGTSESRTQMGLIWQSFNFIVFENLFYDFQNLILKSVFLKSWTCFIPRRDSERAELKFCPFDSLLILLGLFWVTVFTLSKSVSEIWFFEMLNLFYEAKGRCDRWTQLDPFDVFPFYFVWERCLTLSVYIQ